jgi:hypothetical protein
MQFAGVGMPDGFHVAVSVIRIGRVAAMVANAEHEDAQRQLKHCPNRFPHPNWGSIRGKASFVHYKNQSAISPYTDASGKLSKIKVHISLIIIISIY